MTKVSPSEGELNKLIEELKLNQIDLETRNRELNKQISRYKLTTLTNIENESKLFTLADNLPGYIAFVNAKTLKYEYVNKAYQKSFGIPVEEIVGKQVREVIGETNFQFALKYIEMVREGKSASYENTFNMVSGKRWISVNYAPDFDKDGNVSSIIVLTYDITERRQIEQTLKESEEQLQLIIKGTLDYFFRVKVNPDGSAFVEYISDNYSAITNKSISDVQSIDSWRDIIHPDDIETIYTTLRSIITTPKRATLECRSLVLKSIRHLELNVIPVLNKHDGKVTLILGTVKDITERKKAELILKENETKLLQLNAEKDKFFSLIAHDLRSPFNVFLGFTQKMAEEHDTMPIKDLQKITHSMRNSATNLFQLLENLLDWSRFQRGLLNFDRELLLLNTKITESIQLALDSANKKGVKIDMSIPEDMLIFADGNMLGSIVRNLTSNAIKFTPKGGTVLIEACLVQGNATEISVKDTGIGMNKNLLEHLFLLNEKTNRRGTEGEPSTGLGLIICKDFVEKHGGKIWAKSEEGKGSTFKFILPASDIQY